MDLLPALYSFYAAHESLLNSLTFYSDSCCVEVVKKLSASDKICKLNGDSGELEQHYVKKRHNFAVEVGPRAHKH